MNEMDHVDANTLNGTTLAYIGDAVMSLWVREYLIAQGYGKANVLHKKCALRVSARAQSVYLHTLIEQAFFSDEEMRIIMRGRNAKTETKAKHASVHEYRMATGLEAVIGYLYLRRDEARMEALWHEIIKLGEQK